MFLQILIPKLGRVSKLFLILGIFYQQSSLHVHTRDQYLHSHDLNQTPPCYQIIPRQPSQLIQNFEKMRSNDSDLMTSN